MKQIEINQYFHKEKVCDIKECLNLIRYINKTYNYKLCGYHYFNIIESIKKEWIEYIDNVLSK